MGIEPTLKAWEAFVLPLNYTRPFYITIPFQIAILHFEMTEPGIKTGYTASILNFKLAS